MRELPKPEFVKIDPAAIEAELIALYERDSGKSLFPAQIERLFINRAVLLGVVGFVYFWKAEERYGRG
jgi:hypothetical protein